ncbi:MAG: lysophospholipid acyltransferase family protein [bacterium]
MRTFLTNKNTYVTPKRKPGFLTRLFTNIIFYPQAIYIVLSSAYWAKRGKYTDEKWVEKSLATVKALERAGVRFKIENINILRSLDSPCVFIANHMSTLETFVLPGLIQSFQDVTFVVQQGLMVYPVFKHVMISRDPIPVSRKNPRHDLKVVLEEGMERLKNNISLVIFPQSTRTEHFDPKKFNSIGVKLAKKARVPVVPIALKTDAWKIGKYHRDFGKIDPGEKVNFYIGKPIKIQGNGRKEHEYIINFISEKLASWEQDN